MTTKRNTQTTTSQPEQGFYTTPELAALLKDSPTVTVYKDGLVIEKRTSVTVPGTDKDVEVIVKTVVKTNAIPLECTDGRNPTTRHFIPNVRIPAQYLKNGLSSINAYYNQQEDHTDPDTFNVTRFSIHTFDGNLTATAARYNGREWSDGITAANDPNAKHYNRNTKASIDDHADPWQSFVTVTMDLTTPDGDYTRQYQAECQKNDQEQTEARTNHQYDSAAELAAVMLDENGEKINYWNMNNEQKACHDLFYRACRNEEAREEAYAEAKAAHLATLETIADAEA